MKGGPKGDASIKVKKQRLDKVKIKNDLGYESDRQRERERLTRRATFSHDGVFILLRCGGFVTTNCIQNSQK